MDFPLIQLIQLVVRGDFVVTNNLINGISGLYYLLCFLGINCIICSGTPLVGTGAVQFKAQDTGGAAKHSKR